MEVEKNREMTEVVSSFKYLGSYSSTDGAPQNDVKMRMGKGLKAVHAMKTIMFWCDSRSIK